MKKLLDISIKPGESVIDKDKPRNRKRKIKKITLSERISTQAYIEEERNLRIWDHPEEDGHEG